METNMVVKKTKKKAIEKSMHCRKRHMGYESGGVVYGLGFVGALVYYIANATSFWIGVVGFFKAVLWPAFLVFELMKFLGM